MKRPLVLTLALAVMFALAIPASAAPNGKNHQVRGVAFFHPTEGPCPGALELVPQAEGWGLEGCLELTFVDEERSGQSAGGVYKEYGTEHFDGDLVYFGNGGGGVVAAGTFDTEYVITSKWAGAPFESEQFHGRCQHPIIPGSGGGDFVGITGRIDFKDTIVDGEAVEFPYRGHVKLAS